jgi:hypothetical protein
MELPLPQKHWDEWRMVEVLDAIRPHIERLPKSLSVESYRAFCNDNRLENMPPWLTIRRYRRQLAEMGVDWRPKMNQ